MSELYGGSLKSDDTIEKLEPKIRTVDSESQTENEKLLGVDV